MPGPYTVTIVPKLLTQGEQKGISSTCTSRRRPATIKGGGRASILARCLRTSALSSVSGTLASSSAFARARK
jgi:hypothetical protein